MKILVITPFFYPHLGGSERYIEELYSTLSLRYPSIQVDVLTYGFGNYVPVEVYRSLTVYRVQGWEILPNQFALPNYFQLVTMLRRLKSRRYDLINAHTRFFESSWWTPLVKKYFSTKVLLTDHCADHPKHSNPVIAAVARTIDHGIIPILNSRYTSVTTVSHATSKFLLDHGMTIPMTVIPNGVSVGDFHPVQKSDGDKVVVSFVGRDIKAKGIHLYLQAVESLKNTYPGCEFRCVTNRPHQEVIQTLRDTDILVHPSTHHEGLPTVILEAGAAHCAVVATDRGGVTEVIEDEKTGLIIEPSVDAITQAVSRLINDHTLRKQLGENLFDKVNSYYSWDSIAEKYYNFLQDLH